MKKTILLCLVLLSCSLSVALAQRMTTFPIKDTTRPYIRLLFAGDAMQHSTQYIWALEDGKHFYNYEPNFRYLRPYLDSADINIVNFETTLSEGNYSGYPHFRSPDAWLKALADAGFQVFALANNHILDGGKKGMLRTLAKMEPFPHCGAYADTIQRRKTYPLILNIDGLKIALFNCTYGTNQIVPTPPTYVNYIETEEIQMDLERSLKDSTIDLRIFFVHWGTEYELYHNAIQQGTAQWLADMGADAVIGSHPHVVQDQQLLIAKDGRIVPVIYSLGNFVSNQRWENSNGGIVAQIDIDRTTHNITRISYVPFYVHKGYINGQKNYFCVPTPDYRSGRLPFRLPSDSLNNELLIFDRNTTRRMGESPLTL